MKNAPNLNIKMPPLAPLLHSQQQTSIIIKQEECAAYIIAIVIVITAMVFCMCKYRTVPSALPVHRLPRGAKLFTLDGVEIRLEP